jgi:hypothetical protein
MGQRGRPTVYTYEKVAALVPTCRNYYELAVALGMGWVSTEKTQPQVKNLLVNLRKHGPKLDVSHFKKSSPGFVYPPVPRPVPTPKSPPLRVRPPAPSREVLEPLVLSGKTFREIASLTGIGVARVRRLVFSYGIQRPDPYPREVVASHVTASGSLWALAQSLGVSGTVARGLVTKYGLDATHFKRKSYKPRRPSTVKRTPTTRSPVESILCLHPVGTDTSGDKLKRALLSLGRFYECAVCGMPPTWNGQGLRLQVDHINGLGWDDRAENLRFICPNCHSQTPTFCNRNTRRLRELGAPKRAR